MLPLLRTILLLLWFRNFSEVYDFNLMTLILKWFKFEEEPIQYESERCLNRLSEFSSLNQNSAKNDKYDIEIIVYNCMLS